MSNSKTFCGLLHKFVKRSSSCSVVVTISIDQMPAFRKSLVIGINRRGKFARVLFVGRPEGCGEAQPEVLNVVRDICNGFFLAS